MEKGGKNNLGRRLIGLPQGSYSRSQLHAGPTMFLSILKYCRINRI